MGVCWVCTACKDEDEGIFMLDSGCHDDDDDEDEDELGDAFQVQNIWKSELKTNLDSLCPQGSRARSGLDHGLEDLLGRLR